MRVLSVWTLPLLLGAVALWACNSDSSGDDPSRAVSSAIAADDDDDDDSEDILDFGQHMFVHKLRTGNGRACGTCHVPEDEYMLKPATVAARLAALPVKHDGTVDYSRDPLFNSIDANDFADDFTNLQKGLIRVNIALPPNITIAELPGATSVNLWRKTPSVKNVALTAPYQLDRRAPTLDVQALGAARGHSQVTTDPTQTQLDAIAAFELSLFSTDVAQQEAALIAAGQPTFDAQPDDSTLNASELNGKAIFQSACGKCHSSPTFAKPCPTCNPRAFHNVMTGATGVTPNVNHLPLLTIRCTNPDGTITTKVRPDPGVALISGLCADISRFDTPTLYGVANRAPYYHDNQAQTLEEVIDVYNKGLFTLAFPAVQPFHNGPLNAQDAADVIAFVKRL
jgi:cytochrome c peroxidase